MSASIQEISALTSSANTLNPVIKPKNLRSILELRVYRISILSFLTFNQLLCLCQVNKTLRNVIEFEDLAQSSLLNRLMAPWRLHVLLCMKPPALNVNPSNWLMEGVRGIRNRLGYDASIRLRIAAASPACILVSDHIIDERGMTHFISPSTRKSFEGRIIASNKTLALSLSARPESNPFFCNPLIRKFDMVNGTSENLELDPPSCKTNCCTGLELAHYSLYAKYGFIIEEKGKNGETTGEKIITIHQTTRGYNWICSFKIIDSEKSAKLKNILQDCEGQSLDSWQREELEELRKSKYLKLTEFEGLPRGPIEAAYHQIINDQDAINLKIENTLVQVGVAPLSIGVRTSLPEKCFEVTANRTHLFFLSQCEAESKDGATLCMQSPERIEKDAKSTITIEIPGKIQRACMKANEHFLALLYSRTQADQKGTCALQVFSLDGNAIKPIFDKPREFVGRFNDFELHISDRTLAIQTQKDTHFYYIDGQCATRVAVHKDVCTMDIVSISENEMRVIRMGQKGCNLLSFDRNPQTNGEPEGKADSSTDKKDEAPKPDKKETSSSCVVS